MTANKETASSERLAVRLPPTLMATLRAAAKACGLSLSGYVRDRLTSAAQRDLRRARAAEK